MQTFILRIPYSIRFSIVFCSFFPGILYSASLSSSKSFLVSTPISIVGGELGIRGEFNLWNNGGLGLEFMAAPERDDCSKKENSANGCALMTSASEFNLSFSRYSYPSTMSGMFWSASAGLRRSTLEWTRATKEASLKQREENEAFLLSELESSKVNASGPAYRLRAGYRYAAESIPLVSGLYGGLRHFDGTYKDAEQVDRVNVATTADEKKSLRHRMMTGLEIGVEIGMLF